MKRKHETKIGKIIEKYADGRLEVTILFVIIEQGSNNLKKITDEDIAKMPHTLGGFMSHEDEKGLAKAAVEISKQCTTAEIMNYIRCYLTFAPQPNELQIYKDDYSSKAWEIILEALNLNEDEIDGCVEMYTMMLPTNS